MTAQTTPTPGAEERPAWQRYLPAGAAATVAVAALIGIQAASSDGSSATQTGPQGGPPGVSGQNQMPGQQQVPGAGQQQGQGTDGQAGQAPPWGQDGGTTAPGAGQGAPGGPPGMPGQQGQSQGAAPGMQQQAPDDQGLPSARSTVS